MQYNAIVHGGYKMDTEQDAYVPGMEHEGITVFMMGTVMVEYNRKPMPLMGTCRGRCPAVPDSFIRRG